VRTERKRLRCAIYTRKSSEEGLEQSFNSLDAQREAGAAFVESQRHEGWKALAARYDDGGYSGGSMERPALKALLADIDAGKVNVVVVYKVDRLTRSLADFAKMVERFDARGVCFVSVTQQFNTAGSMGRLTLNVLLSFAQFEREVTGERIRDKIAASKKKGMWMGGVVPLGYDLENRKLAVNAGEAEIVREIFEQYLKLGCVRKLQLALKAQGITSKRRESRTGNRSGGAPYSRGALYKILQNRLYRGEIPHRGEVYLGEHPAIVTIALWERVQARLRRSGLGGRDIRCRGRLRRLQAVDLRDRGSARLRARRTVLREPAGRRRRTGLPPHRLRAQGDRGSAPHDADPLHGERRAAAAAPGDRDRVRVGDRGRSDERAVRRLADRSQRRVRPVRLVHAAVIETTQREWNEIAKPISLMFVAGAVLAGCASTDPGASGVLGSGTGVTVSDPTRSGFLTDYARLKPAPVGDGVECWRAADLDRSGTTRC
jgi:DNA invertase Pin-like site-specific DNA recombinase